MRHFIIATILCCLSVTQAFSREINIPGTVISSFETAFPAANNVKWDSRNDLFVASFVMNDRSLYAFYSSDGSFIVVAEVINSMQLPALLAKTFHEKFHDYKVIAVYKMETEDGVSYSSAIEKDNKQFVAKSTGGKWAILGQCKLY